MSGWQRFECVELGASQTDCPSSMPMEDDAFNPLANYEQVEQFDSDLEEEYEEEEVSHTNPAYWRFMRGQALM